MAQGVYSLCDETCRSKAQPPDDCLSSFTGIILKTKHENNSKK